MLFTKQFEEQRFTAKTLTRKEAQSALKVYVNSISWRLFPRIINLTILSLYFILLAESAQMV